VDIRMDGEGIACRREALTKAVLLRLDFFLLSIGASPVLGKRLRPF
jgi:hypothetical protein